MSLAVVVMFVSLAALCQEKTIFVMSDIHVMAPELLINDGEAFQKYIASDPKLLRDLFVGAGDDPLGHAADFHDGAASILTGIAANISLAENRPDIQKNNAFPTRRSLCAQRSV